MNVMYACFCCFVLFDDCMLMFRFFMLVYDVAILWGKGFSCRHEISKRDWQWLLLDHAVKFARWRDCTMGRGARFAATATVCVLLVLGISN